MTWNEVPSYTITICVSECKFSKWWVCNCWYVWLFVL